MSKQHVPSIDLVRELLNVADAQTEPDTQRTMQHALALLFRHNLNGVKRETITCIEIPVHRDKLWRKRAWGAIARAALCRAVYLRGGVEIIGRPENVEIVQEMGTWLLRRLDALAPQEAKAWVEANGSVPAADGDDRADGGRRKVMSVWLHECIDRIDAHLERARREAGQRETKLTLFHAEDDEAIEQFVYARHKRMMRARSPRIGSQARRDHCVPLRIGEVDAPKRKGKRA